MFGRALRVIMVKEMMQMLRTKRLLVVGSILLVALVFFTIVVPLAFFDLHEAPPSDGVAHENLAFLFFLNAPIIGGLFVLQILAVILTADAVCSEWQNKSIFLLLSKPVPRGAFVLGKFLGTTVPLLALVFVLFTADYLVLNALYPGHPSGEDWWRFFGATGMVMLGMLAVAAMGLFFSTLTRSTLPSMVWGLVFAFVLFPLVNSIGDFTALAASMDGEEVDKDDFAYDWSHYATPASSINSAVPVLMDEDMPTFNFLFPQFPPASAWASAVATTMWAMLFMVASMLVVQARNFE